MMTKRDGSIACLLVAGLWMGSCSQPGPAPGKRQWISVGAGSEQGCGSYVIALYRRTSMRHERHFLGIVHQSEPHGKCATPSVVEAVWPEGSGVVAVAVCQAGDPSPVLAAFNYELGRAVSAEPFKEKLEVSLIERYRVSLEDRERLGHQSSLNYVCDPRAGTAQALDRDEFPERSIVSLR